MTKYVAGAFALLLVIIGFLWWDRDNKIEELTLQKEMSATYAAQLTERLRADEIAGDVSREIIIREGAVREIIREVERNVPTTECATSPSIRDALDGLRKLESGEYKDVRPAATPDVP